MDTDFSKEFKECPNCKSTERFFEELNKALKGRGLVPPEHRLYLEVKQNAPISKQVLERLPIGSEIPGFAYATDICTGCGTIYTVALQRVEMKKGIQTSRIIPPKITMEGMGNDPRFS